MRLATAASSSPPADAACATMSADVASSERVSWVLIWYVGLLPAASLAPIIYTRLKHKGYRKPSPSKIRAAASTLLTSSGEATKLEEAEQARKRLHTRVSGALWQAGWMGWWFGSRRLAELWVGGWPGRCQTMEHPQLH